MNKYLRDRLMGRSNMDYAPRGSGRRGRRGDRNSDYEEDDRAYSGRDYARGGSGRGGRSGGSRGGRSGGYDRADMGYDDYDEYRDFEYNYDMHDAPMELSEKHIKKWEKEVKNSDGSHGAKFSKEQIIPIAQQYGIQFDKDKFTEEEFTMAVNMMYSDYCKAFQDSSVSGYSRPELYINMAKAFLIDKDFEGKPYEKLALYYFCISEYDD